MNKIHSNKESKKLKHRGHVHLFALVAFILAVGLACSALTSPATPAPQPPVDSGNSQPQPTDVPQQSGSTGNSSDFAVFTDKNDFFQIEVPSDWKQDSGSGDNYYIDSFTAPDGNALIESIVYDDGTSFPGGTNGKFALGLLHTFYSIDGKEGDIRITDDRIEKDGSESLSWNSRGRGTTGISYFEIRNGTTFLMLSLVYGNDFESQYLDTLNHVISTYAIP